VETTDLDSRLSEYREQLALLEQEDIRTANQSLILDFFCIEERFTEFLRLEVFSDTAARHKTWCHINIRNADSKITLAVEDLSLLLDFDESQDTAIWARIISSTAEKQDNIETHRRINELGSFSRPNINDSSIDEAATGKTSTSKVDKTENIKPVSNDILEDKPENLGGKVSEEKNSHTNANPNITGILTASLIGVGFLATIMTAAFNNSGTGTDGYTPSASSDDTAGLTRLESESKNAVLICEMRPIIERANSLSLSEQSSIARKNKLVSEMNKSIAFLDQRSGKGFKYWEDPNCIWGGQWFDNNTDSAFRAFIAVSKNCVNPVIHYGIVKTGDASDIAFIRKGSVSLGKFDKGEVRLPYFSDYGYGRIDKISCG